MAKIYALMSGQLVLYIGSTIRTLKKRENGHRCKKWNTTGSRHIPFDCEWNIVLLEECLKSEMRVREQHYYDTLKPLYNEHKAFNSLSQVERVQEYQLRNMDKVIAYRNSYCEYCKQKDKEYYIRKKQLLNLAE